MSKYGINHPVRGWLIVGGTPRYHATDSWTHDVSLATRTDLQQARDVLSVMNKIDDLAGRIEVRLIPCVGYPPDREYKTIGLPLCELCGSHDCVLPYLRWDKKHGYNTFADLHHLVNDE